MRRPLPFTLAAAAVGLLVTVPGVSAQANEQTVAWTYTMTPMPGHDGPFQESLAAHAAWRRQQNDPWSWQVYEVVAGDNLGQFLARSSGHTWADLDAYDAGFGPRGNEHFGMNVAPHLESVTGAISMTNWDVSHWPEQDPGFTLFQIIQFNLEFGMEDDFNRTVARFHKTLQEQNFSDYYAWVMPLIGQEGSAITLALPYLNWADMAMPQPSMEQLIFQAVGPAEAMDMFDSFSEAVTSTKSWVLRLRPDLSVGGM